MVRGLRRYWALALVVTLAVMAVSVSAVALAPRTYTATAVVAMVPRPEPRASGDVLRLTIPTYSTLATSQRVAADLAGRFGEDVDLILLDRQGRAEPDGPDAAGQQDDRLPLPQVGHQPVPQPAVG